MNRTINKSLELFRQIMNISGERIKRIEAVKDKYTCLVQDGGFIVVESYNEVAEITYDNDYKDYVYIMGDSDSAAIYDILKAMFGHSKYYEVKGEIERGIYPL